MAGVIWKGAGVSSSASGTKTPHGVGFQARLRKWPEADSQEGSWVILLRREDTCLCHRIFAFLKEVKTNV